MPASLWEAVENYVSLPSVRSDRSEWIRGLVTEALRRANALPDDPVAAELERTKELIATRGITAVRAKHDELEADALRAAAVG